jgi:hypothetical protein
LREKPLTLGENEKPPVPSPAALTAAHMAMGADSAMFVAGAT